MKTLREYTWLDWLGLIISITLTVAIIWFLVWAAWG